MARRWAQSPGRQGHDIAYEETGSPTLVEGLDGTDAPSRGSFRIDVATRTVLRAVIEARPPRMRSRIEIDYKHEPQLGVFVPSTLREKHEFDNIAITGKAAYSKFRSFSVSTAFEIK